MGSWHSLELPEVVGVEVHGSGVSLSESLGNVSVMNSLSIAPLEVAATEANEGAHEESEDADMGVDVVIVILHVSSSTHEVADSEAAKGETESSGLGATREVVELRGASEISVE